VPYCAGSNDVTFETTPIFQESRSLPAISIALSIRIPIASKNEKLRASHFSGGGNDSTKLARHF
jgi:hypothetical protein